MLIQKICMESDKRYLIVASGDLSHCEKEDGPYGFRKEGPEYDARLMRDMGNADFGSLLQYEPAFLEKAQECGHRSFTILGGILDRMKLKPTVLSHEATFGVGYGFVIYDVDGPDETRNFLDQYEADARKRHLDLVNGDDPYIRLAAAAVELWVTSHRKLRVPEDLPEELLKNRAGVFVSLHEHGELRGCIGTI